ncbi:MAG TPA: DinB family protein, partial [Roseiflexaceae bacterium]|nr:DinB family protein [Roseiflexaceae bacterium]
SVLYHIAAIEIDYLYADLLRQPFPEQIVALFPFEVREENGSLTPVLGFEQEWYRERLDTVRAHVIDVFRAMDEDDYRRARHLTDYPIDITPEWAAYHLVEHEAEHRGELASLRTRAEHATRT